MNLKEGMRRTGIVLGLLGACAGGVLAYATASPVWKAWRDQRRFQALVDTPTVRRVSGAEWFAKHSPGADKWCDVDPTVKVPPGYRLDGPCYETNSDDKGRLHWVELQPWERDWSKEQHPVVGQVVNTLLRLESFAPNHPNRDGIALIYYDVRGAVTSFELATGEKIEQHSRPSLLAFAVPLLLPLVGFLLPWGAMKSIAWVAAGFVTSKHV